MLPSIFCNLIIAVAAVAATFCHTKNAPMKIVLRFFTALSNLLCAFAALCVALCRIFGSLPYPIGVLKYVGTAAVTVTMLTVICFLGPTLGYKKMFSGPDFWLHLFCPALAIASYALWDKPSMPFWTVLLGTLPVLLYGIVYIYRVLRAPEIRRWPDFYGFNRGGKWALSYTAMIIAAFAIAVILWWI